MITREEVVQIGQIQRPHGLQGELTFSFTSDVFDEVEFPCLICEIDGILVPFFVESYRFKNDDTALVKFERIDSDEEARILVKAPLYIEKKYLPDGVHESEVEGADYYIGFSIYDEEGNRIGEIKDIDSETENILFLVVNGDEEYIIPASDDFILGIDDEQKIIQMNLPEGLLNLDELEDDND